MWVIRLVLTSIVLVLVLVVGILEHAVTWVVGKFDPDACLRLRYGYVRAGLKAVWFTGGGKAKVLGTENIPADRAVLFVGNHRSMHKTHPVQRRLYTKVEERDVEPNKYNAQQKIP